MGHTSTDERCTDRVYNWFVTCLRCNSKFSRPGSTTGGHAFQVGDDYSLIVKVGILRIYTHPTAPTRGWANDGPIVGTHNRLV